MRTPSYMTFCTAVRKRDRFDQTSKRKGHRAAYSQEPFYFELELKTPRHGDRPFEICHIDHTELDIELVCSRTRQNLGRPWYTMLTDAFSRRLLAIFLTFDPPSYRSCMMVLRECVRRHGRFPQSLVVDGGKEFGSIYFDTLLARFECTKKTRPPADLLFAKRRNNSHTTPGSGEATNGRGEHGAKRVASGPLAQAFVKLGERPLGVLLGVHALGNLPDIFHDLGVAGQIMNEARV